MKKCPKCESYAIVKDGFVGNPPVQRYKCNTCQYRSSKEVTKYKLDSYENAVITSILKGKTYSEIAREIGIHRSSVMRWVKTKSLEEKGLLKRLVLSLMMYLEKVDPKEISRLLALPPILIKFWIKSYKDMPVRNLPRHSGESYEITSWDTSNLFVENKPYRIEYYLGGFTIIIISSIPNEFLPITITKPGSSSQPVLDGFVRMRAIQLQLIGMDSESIVE
ncbi:MAG: helix-turn-helix domain-containing protein, partial [Ekhidna sp.]